MTSEALVELQRVINRATNVEESEGCILDIVIPEGTSHEIIDMMQAFNPNMIQAASSNQYNNNPALDY